MVVVPLIQAVANRFQRDGAIHNVLNVASERVTLLFIDPRIGSPTRCSTLHLAWSKPQKLQYVSQQDKFTLPLQRIHGTSGRRFRHPSGYFCMARTQTGWDGQNHPSTWEPMTSNVASEILDGCGGKVYFRPADAIQIEKTAGKPERQQRL